MRVIGYAGPAPTDLPLNPSKPNLRLPPGSWDTHCHIFGPKELYPFAATTSREPADAPRGRLLALHAMLGIERCVIVQSVMHGVDNRVLEDGSRKSAYLGVALSAPSVAGDERRRLDRLGFRGVRFNFIKHLRQSASIEQVLGLAPRLADIGWHLQIHMEASLIETMASALERSPVPVVIDHIGRVDAGLGLRQPAFQALLGLRQHDRVWVKVSGCDRITRTGPPYIDALPFARKLATEFPDRVLWGSDWPHPNHADPILMTACWSTSCRDGPLGGAAPQIDGRKSAAALRPRCVAVIPIDGLRQTLREERRLLARYSMRGTVVSFRGWTCERLRF